LEDVDWIDLAWQGKMAGCFEQSNETWGWKNAGNVLTKGLLASQDGLCSVDWVNFFILIELRPNAGPCLLIPEVSRAHTKTHHSRQNSSGWVISLSQRPLPDNT
jgi:hypothetical protein